MKDCILVFLVLLLLSSVDRTSAEEKATKSQRVVEELVFEVSSGEIEKFLEQDKKIWTAALSSQEGFLRKEVWRDKKTPTAVKLIIHWNAMSDWMAVSKSLLQETDAAFQAAMGGSDQYRLVSSRAYQWLEDTEPAAASITNIQGELSLDLSTLRETERHPESEIVRVPHDAVYKTAQRYHAISLEELIRSHLDKEVHQNFEKWEVWFECKDGYTPVTTLKNALGGHAFIATSSVDAPDGKNWFPLKNANAEDKLSPYYLVWDLEDRAQAADSPWPYQLTSIRIARAIQPDSGLIPDEKKHQQGYLLFRKHCLVCHAINGTGGTLGPELHAPRNVTEYWRPEMLKAFIRNPQSIRSGSRMPPMNHVADSSITRIVKYLEALTEQRLTTQ